MRSHRLASFLLASLALTSTARSQQAIRRLDGTTVSAAKANSIADAELKNNNVMGAQLAILNHGRVVWTHAYGLRNAEKNLPMTSDTNIWAASITKSVFATWVMRLVEQHRIDLDQPIAQMLPRPLNEYDPYRDSAAEIIHDPQWQQLTPRILLSMSSGLANFAAIEPDKKLHLHFKPGTHFAYSGEGLNLLQFVLEEKFHESLETAMQRDLFVPLGMTSTGLIWNQKFEANMAFRYGADGRYLNATRRDHVRAAGSMATTVNDLVHFTEALLANKILQPATQAQMFTPQITINALHQFPTFAPGTSPEGPRVGLAYGLGWGLLTNTPYGPAFFKEGHGDGAENYLICFTKSGTCVILLTNSDNGELAFRPLLEQHIGDNVTPWEWESYTSEAILHNEEHTSSK